jgi:hypothetical protein
MIQYFSHIASFKFYFTHPDCKTQKPKFMATTAAAIIALAADQMCNREKFSPQNTQATPFEK